MKIRKLIIGFSAVAGLMMISELAFTKLNNFTTVNRAWDVTGPGVATRKDCSACHAGNTPIVNDANMRMFVFDTGQTDYIPGKQYTITFVLKAANSCGFSSTVLRNDSNIMAGSVASVDTNETKVFFHSASGRYYVNHRVGTPALGGKVYQYTWTAPAKGTGAVTFYFSSLNGNGLDDTGEDTVYNNSYVINEGTATGVQSYRNEGINVYPNPASGTVQISLDRASAGNMSVEIIGLDGKVCRTQDMGTISAGNNSFALSLDGLNAGIYFVKVSNGSNQYLKKILVN